MDKKALVRKLALIVIAITILSTLTTVVSAESTKLTVVTTLPFLDYIVKYIGGNYVNVICLLPPGASPETYEPSPKDLEKLVNADVIVATGLHHTRLDEVVEKYAEEGKIKGIYLDVTTYKLYGLTLINVSGSPSPHGFWWDPKDLAAVALAIGDALARRDHSHATYYKARAEIIAEVAKSLSNSLAGIRVAAYSPPDMYFAEGCGAKVVLLLTPDPTQPPTPDKVRSLMTSKASIDLLIVSKVDLMLSKSTESVINKFKESGGKVAIIPLGAPSWDPLSSIIAGIWGVEQTVEQVESKSSGTTGTLSYSDLALVFVVGLMLGIGVMIYWTRKVCG